MIVKIHKNHENQMLVSVCDDNLIGKRFEDGKKQLDISIDFYNGDEKTDEEAADIMRNCYMVNIVGEKSVNLALREQIISRESIKTICDVPYAQAIVVE
jgi:hypothetical protein